VFDFHLLNKFKKNLVKSVMCGRRVGHVLKAISQVFFEDVWCGMVLREGPKDTSAQLQSGKSTGGNLVRPFMMQIIHSC
jgi:hypothetical protein